MCTSENTSYYQAVRYHPQGTFVLLLTRVHLEVRFGRRNNAYQLPKTKIAQRPLHDEIAFASLLHRNQPLYKSSTKLSCKSRSKNSSAKNWHSPNCTGLTAIVSVTRKMVSLQKRISETRFTQIMVVLHFALWLEIESLASINSPSAVSCEVPISRVVLNLSSSIYILFKICAFYESL